MYRKIILTFIQQTLHKKYFVDRKKLFLYFVFIYILNLRTLEIPSKLQFFLELSDDDITAQALLFFIAGFDTVSTAVCHMFYELALNEDIQLKLCEEIDATFKNNQGNITYEVVRKMKYLDMVLSGWYLYIIIK